MSVAARVLIVEDERDQARALQGHLEVEGLEGPPPSRKITLLD